MIRLGCTVVGHAAIDMVREKEMKMTFTDETFSWEDSVPAVILEGNEYECLR